MKGTTIVTILLLVLAMVSILSGRNMRWTRARRNGKMYYVQPRADHQVAAEVLAEVEDTFREFMRLAIQLRPDDPRLKRILQRWDGSLREIEPDSLDIAYTLSKNQISLCIRNGDSELASVNNIMFLLLHEAAHLAQEHYEDHSPAYWQDARFLYELAIRTGHHEYTDDRNAAAAGTPTVCQKKLGPHPLKCLYQGTCQSQLKKSKH